MSALKNLLKSDTPTSSSNAGGMAGQGSHFPKDQDTTASAQPTTVTGTEHSPAGPADTSAAPALQAQDTKGPEARESGHVGTGSASDAPATGASSSQQPPATTSHFPSVGSSKDGSGSAAVGETTTYSSQHLASGDPTGSVVDHHSSDPMTYKLPETSSHNTTGNTGVPPSAASAAASAAWAKGERMPGAFPTPGYENPYKSSHPLDPRVDGGNAGEISPSSASYSTGGLATGAGAGVGAGAAAAGASQAFKSHNATSLAPSTLTTTTNPADRSAEYSKSTDLKGLGSDASTAASTSQPQAAPQQGQGVLGKALGAVGLGSAVEAAATALGYGSKKEGGDEPRETTAIATQPGQTSQESGPPKHYRRESIPTTAYPAGPNSPTPIAPPIGGSQAPAARGDGNDHQPGRDAAIAAGMGGGAAAASQFDKSKEHPGTVTDDSNITAPQSSGQGIGSAMLGAPQAQHQDGAGVRDNLATGVTPAAGSTAHDQTTTAATTGDSHTGRNLAAGGATAVGLGAGAYGVHEYQKDHTTGTPATNAPAGSTTLPDRTRDAPVDAVAAAPSRYDGQDAKPTSALAAETAKSQEDHTARDAAIGAGAGAAVAGGAAYAVDQDKEEQAARKAAAEREKELVKQREAQQKEAAKAEKQHEKELAKEQKQHEKEERKHQKELKKEEKKHQKELEKEEKKHAKEAEKQEKEREAAALEAQKRAEARRIDEDEDRMRREREAAAGLTTGAVAGSAAGGMFHGNEQRPGVAAGEPGYDQQHAHDEAEKHKHEKEKEKKPSIFRRIFKRRKNKDTGEEEEYSTDDEEDKARHAAAVGGAAGSAAAAPEEGSHIPHHHSEAKGRSVLGYAPERTSAEQPSGPTAARVYDAANDPEASGRLSREPGATDDVVHGRGTGNASLGTGEGAHTIATAAGGHLPGTATEPPAEIGDHRR